MVTTILSGGLGNQMFQYAAGRALSLRLNTEMSVDLYKLTKKSQAIRRDYQLDIFDIPAQTAQSCKVKFVAKSFLYLKNSVLGKKLFALLNIFTEESPYDSRFESLEKNAVLFGYFQNERYFESYKGQIREDFTFRRVLDDKNKDLAEHMKQSGSVSIHIRRGDYLHTGTSQVLLDMDYYTAAIKYIDEMVEKPSFFIFSDDTDWVKQNLNLADYPCVFVDWNKDETSYIDMQLMSCCKYNVIANSSFSWWAAWLNSNPDKIVIAPAVWYKNQKPGDYIKGFIPDDWIIL